MIKTEWNETESSNIYGSNDCFDVFFLRDYCLGNKRTVKIKRGTLNTDFYVRNQESGECI